MACANAVGLLFACLEQMLSSLSNNGSDSGGGTIASSTLMHLAGAGRVKLVNYSTCLHRLARVVALPAHPGGREDKNCDGNGPEQSGVEEGQGAVGPVICTAGVPTAEMDWGMDLGTSALEGSNVQDDWAMDFGSVVGGGGGNEEGEAEDVLGAIIGGGGGSGSIPSAWSGRQ
jgi:hypothetical protein